MNYDDAKDNRINKDYNSDRIYEYDGICDKDSYYDNYKNDKMGTEERGCIDFGVYRCEARVMIMIDIKMMIEI